MKALKTVAVALGITLAALVVIPLVVLAGLFVWLKLTQESDEEALELDQEGAETDRPGPQPRLSPRRARPPRRGFSFPLQRPPHRPRPGAASPRGVIRGA